MKKIIITLFLLLFIPKTFWSSLDNLSIEKEVLYVKMINEKINPCDTYIWEKFILDKINNTKTQLNYYNNNLFNLKNKIEPILSGKLAFIKEENWNYNNSVFEYNYEIFIKNNSSKEITKNINYTNFYMKNINPYTFEKNYFYNKEEFLKNINQILIFPNEKSEIYDLEIFLDWEKIDFKKQLKLIKSNNDKLLYFKQIEETYYFLNKYNFNINLKSNEEKKIVIKFKKVSQVEKVINDNWLEFWNNFTFNFLWNNIELTVFPDSEKYFLDDNSTSYWKNFIKSDSWFFYLNKNISDKKFNFTIYKKSNLDN